MKTNIKILLLVLGTFFLGILMYFVINKNYTIPIVTENGIVGCYVAHLAKDVFTLKITFQEGDLLDGKLNINNAEKDSSTGTLKGTYKNGIILADYTFASEGTLSVNQVIFKKVGIDFVRGYGQPDDATGTRFVDLSKIIYDSSIVYKATTDNCVLTPAIQPNITLTDGRQCYAYSHEATTTEPYAVNEFLNITISGTKVSGTKTGTQKGPDMNNGYTGTIIGTSEKNIITDILSYTVEGSKGKEKEIYQANKTGIEKLRYPLVEEKEVLVPDTTKAYQALTYTRVGCTGSN